MTITKLPLRPSICTLLHVLLLCRLTPDVTTEDTLLLLILVFRWFTSLRLCCLRHHLLHLNPFRTHTLIHTQATIPVTTRRSHHRLLLGHFLIRSLVDYAPYDHQKRGSGKFGMGGMGTGLAVGAVARALWRAGTGRRDKVRGREDSR
ncbi:Uncharacterized protein Adt_47349 [Abeliophyllum distichum]|uniref:Secreted protein n=1 Tax=Abeliophyllum distichum TaxID=126358 RepID=A0ABD1NV87_9LAMI